MIALYLFLKLAIGGLVLLFGLMLGAMVLAALMVWVGIVVAWRILRPLVQRMVPA